MGKAGWGKCLIISPALTVRFIDTNLLELLMWSFNLLFLSFMAMTMTTIVKMTTTTMFDLRFLRPSIV